MFIAKDKKGQETSAPGQYCLSRRPNRLHLLDDLAFDRGRNR